MKNHEFKKIVTKVAMNLFVEEVSELRGKSNEQNYDSEITEIDCYYSRAVDNIYNMYVNVEYFRNLILSKKDQELILELNKTIKSDREKKINYVYSDEELTTAGTSKENNVGYFKELVKDKSMI